MPLLLLFLTLSVAAGLLFWRITTQTSYRVKNRDVRPTESSHARKERPGPDLSNMLD